MKFDLVKKFISCLVVLSFAYSNISWAITSPCAYQKETLSAKSQLRDIFDSAKLVYTGTALHSKLITEGITELRTLCQNQEAIRQKLIEIVGEEANNFETIVFEGNSGVVYYTFNREDGYFYRFRSAECTDDAFNRLIARYLISKTDSKKVEIDGKIYYQEIIKIDPEIVPLVKACLDKLYPKAVYSRRVIEVRETLQALLDKLSPESISEIFNVPDIKAIPEDPDLIKKILTEKLTKQLNDFFQALASAEKNPQNVLDSMIEHYICFFTSLIQMAGQAHFTSDAAKQTQLLRLGEGSSEDEFNRNIENLRRVYAGEYYKWVAIILLHDAGKFRDQATHDMQSFSEISEYGLFDICEEWMCSMGKAPFDTDTRDKILLAVKYHTHLGQIGSGQFTAKIISEILDDDIVRKMADRNPDNKKEVLQDILNDIALITALDVASSTQVKVKTGFLRAPLLEVYFGVINDFIEGISTGRDEIIVLEEIAKKLKLVRVGIGLSMYDKNLTMHFGKSGSLEERYRFYINKLLTAKEKAVEKGIITETDWERILDFIANEETMGWVDFFVRLAWMNENGISFDGMYDISSGDEINLSVFSYMKFIADLREQDVFQGQLFKRFVVQSRPGEWLNRAKDQVSLLNAVVANAERFVRLIKKENRYYLLDRDGNQLGSSFIEIKEGNLIFVADSNLDQNLSDEIIDFKDAVMPNLIDWQITDRCQLNCPHCYGAGLLMHPVIARYGKGQLSFEQQKRIVDILAEKGVRTVCFSGGEPLLVPRIDELCAYMRSKGINTLINTNGLQVKKDMDGFFVEIRQDGGGKKKVSLEEFISHLDQMNFSFDTTDPDSFRGEFPNRLAEVIREIKNICRRNNRDIEVQLTTTVMRANKDKIISDLLPKVTEITSRILDDNLAAGNEMLSIFPPIWKLNVYRPQKRFATKNAAMGIPYAEYEVIYNECRNMLKGAMLGYCQGRKVLDDIAQQIVDRIIRVNKHWVDASYKYVIIMPNGALVTIVEESNINGDELPLQDYELIGNLNTESPWVFRALSERVAQEVSRKLMTLRGAVYEQSVGVSANSVKEERGIDSDIKKAVNTVIRECFREIERVITQAFNKDNGYSTLGDWLGLEEEFIKKGYSWDYVINSLRAHGKGSAKIIAEQIYGFVLQLISTEFTDDMLKNAEIIRVFAADQSLQKKFLEIISEQIGVDILSYIIWAGAPKVVEVNSEGILCEFSIALFDKTMKYDEIIKRTGLELFARAAYNGKWDDAAFDFLTGPKVKMANLKIIRQDGKGDYIVQAVLPRGGNYVKDIEFALFFNQEKFKNTQWLNYGTGENLRADFRFLESDGDRDDQNATVISKDMQTVVDRGELPVVVDKGIYPEKKTLDIKADLQHQEVIYVITGNITIKAGDVSQVVGAGELMTVFGDYTAEIEAGSSIVRSIQKEGDEYKKANLSSSSFLPGIKDGVVKDEIKSKVRWNRDRDGNIKSIYLPSDVSPELFAIITDGSYRMGIGVKKPSAGWGRVIHSNPIDKPDMIMVVSGEVKYFVYSYDGRLVEERILKAGDMMISSAPHNVYFDGNARVIEIAVGPFNPNERTNYYDLRGAKEYAVKKLGDKYDEAKLEVIWQSLGLRPEDAVTEERLNNEIIPLCESVAVIARSGDAVVPVIAVNSQVYAKDGTLVAVNGRLYFDKVERKVILYTDNGEEIVADFSQLRKDVFGCMDEAGVLQEDIAALVPVNNLYLNWGVVVYKNGTLYTWGKGNGEGELEKRVDGKFYNRLGKKYSSLVVYKDGTWAIEDLIYEGFSYDRQKGFSGGRIYKVNKITGEKTDITDIVDSAIYGQRIVNNGTINYGVLSEEFDDMNHLFCLPLFRAESTSGFKELYFGTSELVSDRLAVGTERIQESLIYKALNGEPIQLDTSELRIFSEDNVTKTFAEWGYRKVDDSKKVLQSGEYRFIKGGNKIEICLLPGINPLNLIGIDKDGNLTLCTIPGESRKKGTNLQTAAKYMIDQGAVEVLCVSQGKDGMMWQKGKLAAKSVDGNTGATCVLGLVDAKSCSVCGGHKQRPLFDVKPIKLGKVPEEAEVVKGHGYRVPVVYRIIQCQHCGFIYVANQQGDLSSLYESEYFERSSDKRRMKLATARQEMRAIREVIGADIGRELKMVDCGPGDGYHLEIAQSEFGWDAEGVDVSDAAINNCSSRGLVVKKGTLKEQEYEGNSIDLVTLFATVEHLTDPRGEIEEINRILKPGGHVVLTRLPNLDSEVGAAQGSEYYDIKVGHLNYFSPGTIRRLLEEKGFEVVFIKTTVNDWIVEEHRNGRISDEDFNRIMQNKEAIEQSGRGELVTVVAKKVYGRDEKKPVSQGSHLVRKVKGDEAEKPLYDFTINEKGELSGDDDVYAPTLKLCMERLIHIYGLGILTRIKNIQVIENLNGGNLYPIGRAPLASYKDDILKIDVLAFENGPWILFEEIEHEFIESIAGLIPGDNEILADIVSTYRNVLRFLNPNDGITNTRFKYDVPVYQEGILSVLRAPANPIDPDGEYLALLERLLKLKEQDKLSEDEIIVRVVQYIMRTKLYEKVRQQLGLEDDIAKKIRDMDPKLDDALSIFNEITKAKNSVDLMDKIRRTSRGTIIVTKTFTGLRAKGLEKISKGLAEIVGALVKQVNNTDKLSAMLTNKDTTKKYIFVNSDGLNRLKEAMGEKDYQAVVDNLERNNIELVTEMPEEVALENVIRLVEDPDVLKDMPKIEGMYYLPMPYTRSAVYMAANIIQAKGDLSLIPLVRELIKDLYKELSEDDLRLLITQPWTILPKINPVIQEINEIREEIFEIERAA